MTRSRGQPSGDAKSAATEVQPSAAWSVGDQQNTWCKLKGFRPVGPLAVGPPVAYVFGAEEAAEIAATPDLLAALRVMVLNDPHTYRDCHKAAVAAIAKAEGK
jgi:hypothetical protein